VSILWIESTQKSFAKKGPFVMKLSHLFLGVIIQSSSSFIFSHSKRVESLLKSTKTNLLLDEIKGITSTSNVEILNTLSPSQIDELCAQYEHLNQSYPGGVTKYVDKAKILLKNAVDQVNPVSSEVERGIKKKEECRWERGEKR